MLRKIIFISLIFIASLSYADAKTGKQIYNQYCAACHNVGTAQAPRLNDTETWKKLLDQAGSTSVLTDTVIKGKGVMPAMGGCATCSHAQLRDAVEYMLPNKESTSARFPKKLPLDLIQLPPGFSISIYADNVPGARSLTLAKDGTVFVGTRDQGKVYAVTPNKDFTHAKDTMTIAEGLNDPNGVAYHNNDLYVAEINQVLRYPDILSHLTNPSKPTVINNSFPNRRWHAAKVIKFGPDGRLYIAVGMPCNTCDYRKTQPMFGTIMSMKADGSDLTIFAKGIRHSVGFDWNPLTDVLWFTDNGQDMMGDDLPPDELNRAPKSGMDFGFPYFYGQNTPYPKYIDQIIPSKGMTPSALDLQAHVAVLGITFYRGKLFPQAYRNQAFIAQHGSWNRSSKVGYQVISVKIQNGEVIDWKPFAKGWLQGQTAWGRPVDVLTMPDGSLLISDDQAGVIYRVSYQ